MLKKACKADRLLPRAVLKDSKNHQRAYCDSNYGSVRSNSGSIHRLPNQTKASLAMHMHASSSLDTAFPSYSRTIEECNKGMKMVDIYRQPSNRSPQRHSVHSSLSASTHLLTMNQS